MGKHINVEERLLGMMGVEKRFITEKQLTECLNTIEFFEPNKTLEQVFLDKGYLTPAQIVRLREQLESSIEVDTEKSQINKKLFGEMALEQNMITEDQLFAALDEQEKYLERGLRVQFGQILFKKGYLTMAQVGRILDGQLKKVLCCKKCGATNVVHNYDTSQIYQCETCGLDMVEAKVKKKSVEPQEEIDDDFSEDGFGEEDDIGGLEVLEL